MRMNPIGRLLLNSPARAFAQQRYVLPTMQRLGGDARGCSVLELGCGRGVGSELLLDEWQAASVAGLDIDPTMVDRARSRLQDRADIRLADMTDLTSIDREADGYDVIVEMGALHIEPRWREALGEVRRLLRPSGRFCFEEIVSPRRQALVPLATGRRITGGFGRQPLLDELDRLGLDVLGLARPRVLPLTATVGDLIGVARLRPG